MLTPSKIIEIFVEVDDFCKEYEIEIVGHQLDAGTHKIRNRKASLSDSEVITILIVRLSDLSCATDYTNYHSQPSAEQ